MIKRPSSSMYPRMRIQIQIQKIHLYNKIKMQINGTTNEEMRHQCVTGSFMSRLLLSSILDCFRIWTSSKQDFGVPRTFFVIFFSVFKFLACKFHIPHSTCFPPRDSQLQDIFNPTWMGWNSLALPWSIVRSKIYSCFKALIYWCKFFCEQWRETIEVGIMHHFLQKTCTNG